MPAQTRRAAAGSAAAALTGVLLLAGPAVAAPGSAACEVATARLDAALAETGTGPAAVTQLEETTAAVAASQATYDALTRAAAGPVLAELEAVEAQREAAARAGDAQAAREAGLRIDELLAVLYPLLDTPEIHAARHSLEAGQVAFATLVKALALDEATAERLVALAQERRAACGADPVTGGPVVAPPAPADPGDPALPGAPTTPAGPVGPATPAPPAAGPESPGAMNPGLNMQTAAEEQAGLAAVPLAGPQAGLLLLGAAVPVAAALRRCARRHRA
ncbi:hypothetical protein [Kocuria turfanensis]|uniref:DUF5667 domain-containing protein n=1 Tax=Kocuria turfanensis TaxID=388357 RepID=A0A512IG56_9MICC|nr:hypothetical protein [Kocuria turfanensis]GEO96640.1 hypothetical protein KTU01_27630 [Kocuria turfanensis]